MKMYLDILVDDEFYGQIPYELEAEDVISEDRLIVYCISKMPSLSKLDFSIEIGMRKTKQ